MNYCSVLITFTSLHGHVEITAPSFLRDMNTASTQCQHNTSFGKGTQYRRLYIRRPLAVGILSAIECRSRLRSIFICEWILMIVTKVGKFDHAAMRPGRKRAVSNKSKRWVALVTKLDILSLMGIYAVIPCFPIEAWISPSTLDHAFVDELSKHVATSPEQ